jgi:hypothetical protein
VFNPANSRCCTSSFIASNAGLNVDTARMKLCAFGASPFSDSLKAAMSPEASALNESLMPWRPSCTVAVATLSATNRPGKTPTAPVSVVAAAPAVSSTPPSALTELIAPPIAPSAATAVNTDVIERANNDPARWATFNAVRKRLLVRSAASPASFS